ncbi:CAMK/CAMKL/PASK protein kinase [Purpureocillium lavendulum]|uniref:non-specific serine/threonine protein kinase n=1 Tax=Purpureocillium lavendulum TaxID=1247861 RepID=A0AB34G650_9HYPO|nr:CAMK/CAMKL/PASK protein kinase [Purpureocillium lavendulum]
MELRSLRAAAARRLRTGASQAKIRSDNIQGEDERGRGKLVAPLTLPKNRSTGNLARSADGTVDRSRYRMSFEAPAAAVMDFDAMARSPHMPDHEHGQGLSGLRRIRQQHPPSRAPTVPNSNASSRSPSVAALSRSTSMTGMLASLTGAVSLPGGPTSPKFSEDLSRFPSESLHSFSFAHQSEDFIHNRQTVLKRSMEFMKDRMGRAASVNATQAGIASAQARVTGDIETQNMLELLARAQLIGAGNLPNPDLSMTTGPLTGPADVSGENLFEKDFTPQSVSASRPLYEAVSPSTTTLTTTTTPKSPQVQFQEPKGTVPEISSATRAEVDRSSEESSRTPTNESGTTTKTSPPASRPTSLKRTMTDTLGITMQDKLIDTMTQPFIAGGQIYEEPAISPVLTHALLPSKNFPSALGPAVHGHTNRWVPAAQAIFTTEAKPPWTIIAANDLACLVFGVTKAEVRRMGILEVVQEERRAWLERKLLRIDDNDETGHETAKGSKTKTPAASAASTLLGSRSGITAQLLSKPNSRSQPPKYSQRRAQTVHSGDPNPPKARGSGQHRSSLSRGVLLCGDVVPIQKRNGATGSASLWVKEKRIGLIWVLEEIHEDVANVELDEEGAVKAVTGAAEPIWGSKSVRAGIDIASLIPRIPRQGIDPTIGEIDFAQVNRRRYFTCPGSQRTNVPCTVEQVRGKLELRVSTFPHMAGIVVVDPASLEIRSSNSVFCGALFGHEKPDGMPINALVPEFDKILDILTEEDGLQMLDGMVVPEHRFRRASAFLALREHRPDAGAFFLQPDGLRAKHRDGSDLKVDVQMRVVESEKQPTLADETVIEGSDEDEATGAEGCFSFQRKEMVFALWITYSRHLHAHGHLDVDTAEDSGTETPLHQPSPGQTPPLHTPQEITSDEEAPKKEKSAPATLSKQLKDAAMSAAAKLTRHPKPAPKAAVEKPPVTRAVEPTRKKTIDDYTILEDMGQGAYGQVKLARHKTTGKKVVLKYVTKRRILVDTWTRDRKLGTVPLEIHVLDYLRRPEFRHPNIVEMEGFFEDDVNYYIEMAPHGLPGMDLFDYIELRANMEEAECRSIFVQVAQAIHFLHTKALVVHRDIKDENVILDGEGNIKLIDFGSAAYIKSGPFDVFVGTIEVLAGKPYGGKEQDVWALGILLYTIIYKENPFYSIDEIMDRDLRIPFTMSDESIDLIRCMLNRDVKERYDIKQVLEHPWCKAAAST